MNKLMAAALMLLAMTGAVVAQETEPKRAVGDAKEKAKGDAKVTTEPDKEAKPGVQFMTDLDEAKKLAEAENKKLLLYFTIPN